MSDLVSYVMRVCEVNIDDIINIFNGIISTYYLLTQEENFWCHLQADNYRSELDHCRSSLNAVLETNATLARCELCRLSLVPFQNDLDVRSV